MPYLNVDSVRLYYEVHGRGFSNALVTSFTWKPCVYEGIYATLY
jgi:hypothetical protein